MDEESLYLWLNKKNETNVSEIWALLSIFTILLYFSGEWED